MDGKFSPELILEKVPALATHFRLSKNMRNMRKRLRVLVVEDQPFSQKILSEILKPDYDVDVATTAKEGVRLFLQEAPDVSLLDIELMGESGHTLAHFIKSIDDASFVVMVTGNNSVEDVAMAKSNNVDGFILKPYNKAKVIEAVEKFYLLHPERKVGI